MRPLKTLRPLSLTLTGTALGLAIVLPMARQLAVPADAGVQLTRAAPIAALPGIPAAPPAASAATTVTATGPVVATRYGPVQVRVVMTGQRLVSADALRLPTADSQSRQISRYAGPRLAQQAVMAQGGAVDTVSGATWTSDGYRRSLQAALDTARAAVTTPPAAA